MTRPTTRRIFTLLSAGTALAVSAASPDAKACGGFFCSASTPVDQAAERIIFAQDGEGRVTQIVEVLYEGPAESFSWVLPVPGVPEPGVSSSQVFDRLQNATNPRYQLQQQNACYNDEWLAGAGTGGSSAATGGTDSGPPPPTVTVLDAGSVGPFDYETIAVDAADEDPADVAVRWLEENGYDVGPRGAEVLRPYLQNGLNLIAFRLQKGESSGAIRPITLEYDARLMAIPIRPTAVAAKDDMPILVWTLGAHRAVPTNYYDLELNELLINWFNYRSTYDAVVTAAANEAGGQGFVTELAGATTDIEPLLRPTASDVDIALASGQTEISSILDQMTRQLLSYDGYREVAAEYLTLRAGVTTDDFLSCVYCYFSGGFAQSGVELAPAEPDDPIYSLDVEAFRAAAREEVLQPFFDVADLMLENPYITRLYTTMSADEMTADPVFEFNPDAEDISNVHTAEQVEDCDAGTWEILLPGGELVVGEGTIWPYSLALSELPVNARIRQFSTTGPAQVVMDNITPSDEPSTPGVLVPGMDGTGSSSGADTGSWSNSKGGCNLHRQANPEPWAWVGLGLLGALMLRSRRRV